MSNKSFMGEAKHRITGNLSTLSTDSSQICVINQQEKTPRKFRYNKFSAFFRNRRAKLLYRQGSASYNYEKERKKEEKNPQKCSDCTKIAKLYIRETLQHTINFCNQNNENKTCNWNVLKFITQLILHSRSNGRKQRS